MCCLAYEQPAYEYLNSITPGVGSVVKTPDGTGVVTEVNVISGVLRVRRMHPAHQCAAMLRKCANIFAGGKRVPKKPQPEPEMQGQE